MMHIYSHLLLAALLSIGAHAVMDNITKTCHDFALLEMALGMDQLSAGCQTSTHSITNSTLDLNLCVGIDPTSAVLLWSI